MAVFSALLVFGSIAAFATLYASADHEQPVLIVTQTIEQGQRIMAGDLGQASAAISGGVVPIPVADAAELSGRRAAVTIPPGSLLTLADTTATQPISSGDAVVGMALKPGQLPAAGVEPGEQVMIIETEIPGTPLASPPSKSSPTSVATGPGVLVPRASVFDVQAGSPNAVELGNNVRTLPTAFNWCRSKYRTHLPPMCPWRRRPARRALFSFRHRRRPRPAMAGGSS